MVPRAAVGSVDVSAGSNKLPWPSSIRLIDGAIPPVPVLADLPEMRTFQFRSLAATSVKDPETLVERHLEDSF